ncbi:MAG: PQQ-binding-like beta-propeller repeat protein, partial [Acidithiobacillus sp.]
APVVVGGHVIQALGNGDIYALDRKTGATEHVYHNRCGGFGPQNGVVIGNTYFIGSNAGCMEAIPVRDILGAAAG